VTQLSPRAPQAGASGSGGAPGGTGASGSGGAPGGTGASGSGGAPGGTGATGSGGAPGGTGATGSGGTPGGIGTTPGGTGTTPGGTGTTPGGTGTTPGGTGTTPGGTGTTPGGGAPYNYTIDCNVYVSLVFVDWLLIRDFRISYPNVCENQCYYVYCETPPRVTIAYKLKKNLEIIGKSGQWTVTVQRSPSSRVFSECSGYNRCSAGRSGCGPPPGGWSVNPNIGVFLILAVCSRGI
jgi:hypothetical protein